MATISLSKVSGMLIITQTTGLPKYYGATAIASAKFSPSSNGLYINLEIGNDNFQIAYGDVKVTSTTATTLSSALTLLNSIIGT